MVKSKNQNTERCIADNSNEIVADTKCELSSDNSKSTSDGKLQTKKNVGADSSAELNAGKVLTIDPTVSTEKLLIVTSSDSTGNPKKSGTENVLTLKQSDSTDTRSKLRLIVSTGNQKSVSTDTEPESISQQELINAHPKDWVFINGKPPYPQYHVLNARGKRQIGRRMAVGYEILRRVPCVNFQRCKQYVRMKVGYISATQMIELEEENKNDRVGIVRNILRKKAAEIERRRFQHIRCARCQPGYSVHTQTSA